MIRHEDEIEPAQAGFFISGDTEHPMNFRKCFLPLTASLVLVLPLWAGNIYLSDSDSFTPRIAHSTCWFPRGSMLGF